MWACKNYDGDVQSDIVAQVGAEGNLPLIYVPVFSLFTHCSFF